MVPSVSGPNQYDFIVNANNKHSTSWLVAAPLKTRITVVSVGGLVLLLIIWIGIALLTASSGGSAQNFTVLTQEQAELVRISQEPANDHTLGPIQDFAVTTEVSLASDQQAFLTYLQATGTTLSSQVLAARHNTQSDSQLAAAKQAGTYGQTYTSITQGELNSYAAGLRQAFSATSNVHERQLIDNAYRHAELLIVLSKQGS